MAKRYENFDLEIRRSGDSYSIHVTCPAGRVTAPFHPPLTDEELKILGLTVARGRRTRALASTREVDEVKAYGKRLFDGVFTSDVLASYHQSLSQLRTDRERGMRIRLRLDGVPELAQVPWEYLYDAANRRFVALEDETPVIRYLDLPLPAGPLEVEPPLNVLVMISSPSDIASLDVDQEWTRINQALGDLVRAGHVRLDRLDDATVSGLRWKLKERDYHVFHFIGHGGVDGPTGRGVLIFEDEAGRSDVVDAETVAGLLSAERTLRLAVLNACEGGRAAASDIYAGVAQTLVQRDVPAVIGMQFEISDDAAITLTHDFYKALSLGDPVDAALTEARRGLRWEKRNELEWGTPVLYTRVGEGRLFEVKGEAKAADPSTLPPTPAPELVVSDEAVTLGDDTVRTDRIVAELIHESQLAVYSERWGDAARLLHEVLDRVPGHEEATSRLAAVRRQEELATLFRTASEHQQAGQLDAALDCLERVRRIDPRYRAVEERIQTIRRRKDEERKDEERKRIAARKEAAAPAGKGRAGRRWARRMGGVFGVGAVVVMGLYWLGSTVEPEYPFEPPYEPPVAADDKVSDPYGTVPSDLEPEPGPPPEYIADAGGGVGEVAAGEAYGETATARENVGSASEPTAAPQPPSVPPPQNRDPEARALGMTPYGPTLTGRLAEGGEHVHDLTLEAGSTYVIGGSCDGACDDLDLAVSELGTVLVYDEDVDAVPVVTVIILGTQAYQVHVTMHSCSLESCEYRVQAYR